MTSRLAKAVAIVHQREADAISYQFTAHLGLIRRYILPALDHFGQGANHLASRYIGCANIIASRVVWCCGARGSGWAFLY